MLTGYLRMCIATLTLGVIFSCSGLSAEEVEKAVDGGQTAEETTPETEVADSQSPIARFAEFFRQVVIPLLSRPGDTSQLLGQAAPPIQLELLDGGKFDLADHAGNDILIVSFWATWCGPCVAELPLLVEIANEYQDKAVSLYAINQGEDAETVREFLAEQELKIPVVLDPDYRVGNLYAVSGIPTLAIIDKAGVIQSIHVGYDPAIQTTLRRELDDLLAGKDLAAETLRIRASLADAAPQEAETPGMDAAYSPREIPAGPDVPTSAQYKAQEREFLTRTILEEFKSIHTEAKEEEKNFNALVEQFLQRYVDKRTLQLPASERRELYALGEQISEAGCDDPMFAYCYGALLQGQNRLEESRKYLRVAYDNFPHTSYDPSYRSWAASKLEAVLRDLHVRDKDPDPDSYDLLVPAITSGAYLPEEQRVLFWHIEYSLSEGPLDRIEPLVNEVSSHDDVDPWLKHMMSGYMDFRRGWEARGHGWASEVTEDGWKEFGKRLESAHAHFTQAWELNPHAPESAAQLIGITMTGYAPGNETPRLWFDRTVSAQLDYIPAYSSLRQSLLPRWGGSHRTMYAFGRECLLTRRFDTWVPYELFNTIQKMDNDYGTDISIYERPGVYEDLLQLCDGYGVEGSRASNPDWYHSLKIALAVKCHEWSDAHDFLAALGGTAPQADPFNRLSLKVEESLGEIAARTGDFSDSYREAERLFAAADYQDAETQFQTLVERSSGQEPLTGYLRGRLKIVERIRRFSDGKSISILPDSELDGWIVKEGHWTVDAKGRLVGESSKEGLEIDCQAEFGTRYEIRAQVEFIDSPFRLFNIGFYFGDPTDPSRRTVRCYQAEDYIGLFTAAGNEPLQKSDAPVKSANQLLIQRWDETLHVFLNDKLVMRDVIMELDSSLEGDVIGIGGHFWYTDAKIVFNRLEIQKLTTPPSPAAEEE